MQSDCTPPRLSARAVAVDSVVRAGDGQGRLGHLLPSLHAEEGRAHGAHILSRLFGAGNCGRRFSDELLFSLGWVIKIERHQPTKDRTEPARVTAAAEAVKNGNQLELGRLVVQEIEHRQASTADLIGLAKQIGCSLRTLRYAADVYRLAQRVGLSAQEVARIGWTKLAVVASEEISTKRQLEALCEGRTVTELRATMSGTAGTVKNIVFTLNKGSRNALEAALIRFGARRSGRSLLDKEEALVKLVAATN